MEDTLTIATAEGVRIYAITTKNLVQEAADRHHTSHLATAALGRAMSGALMLAATMKDGERILLKLKGDGPMGEVVAEAQGTSVRGYVGEPDVFMPLKNGKLDIGGALGQGTITLTRYLQNGESFTGHAELADGEIATDITNYLYMSEQTPSSVALWLSLSICPLQYYLLEDHFFPLHNEDQVHTEQQDHLFLPRKEQTEHPVPHNTISNIMQEDI